MIKVDKAIQTALSHLVEIFGKEATANSVLLEEVDLNNLTKCWEVTFSFPARSKNNMTALQEFSGIPAREYKIVKIDSESGEFKGAKSRMF